MTDWDEDDADLQTGDAGLVRPFLLTGGRVRATRELPFETLVQPTLRSRARLDDLAFEQRMIVERYEVPVAVAEISAHLEIPIKATQIIVCDMLDAGLLEEFETSGETADRDLLTRLLQGVRAL